MRFSLMTFTAVATLLAGFALAQQSGGPTAAGAQAAAQPQYAQQAAAAGCDNYCDSVCGNACWPSLAGCGLGICDLGDPWELSSGDNCWNLKVGGWMQAGYYTQGQYPPPPAAPNGTSLFNTYVNTVQMQQAWAYIERPVDTGGCGVDFGGRVDYVYGTDGPDTQAFGNPGAEWDNGWDYGAHYGSAVPQAYVQLGWNDLTITAGKFFTIVGYEVVMAPNNFFYSHAFTQYNAEPFTHTGVLADYALGDHITLWGGWTMGWDTGFVQNQNGSTFLAGMSLQLTQNLSAAYVATLGNFGGISDDDGYSHSIVVDWALTEKLEVVLQGDYIDNSDFIQQVVNSPDGTKVYGANTYLFYYVNDCLAIGNRLEWYSDPRQPDEVLAYTFGLNVKPHANVVLRPEYRYQRYASVASESFFGMDAIITF